MRGSWIATAVLCLPVGAQQTPTIRVPVRLVTVPALVFSQDGRLVPALDATDFHVFDHNRPQKVRLDTEPLPLSIVLTVQTNLDARAYLPFIAKVGSAVDALLVGQTGEAAVIAYNDDVTVQKPFDGGDLHSALVGLSAAGRQSRMIDAGV